MFKVNYWTFLVVLSVFSLQSQALTIVNNSSVSSDFLQEIFFDEIQHNFNFSDIISGDYVATAKCIFQLRSILKEFPSRNSARFLDSWGKFPSGLLYGHLTDFGNYDQCVRTSVVFNNSNTVTKGKYCYASIPLISTFGSSEKDLEIFSEIPIETRALTDIFKIKLGICVPDVCTANILTNIFQNAAAKVLNGALSGVTISKCKDTAEPTYTTADIIAIVIFSVVGCMTVLSTLYDVYAITFKKTPSDLLLAFSIITNSRKLFMINTKTSSNTINCLTGIRVFSMMWVLHAHNYMFSAPLNWTNTVDVLSWYKQPLSMTILMGTVSVDSFFFLSGLLVSWLGLRELDKRNGKLNVIMMWVHRYIRLTPALAALILFYVSLNKHIGSGPKRDTYISLHKQCETNWWVTLLYVQNYVRNEKTCVMQSWYLAIDTQLYFLSPLLLIPLWRWRNKFLPVILALALLSIGCVFGTFISEGYTGLVGFAENNRSPKIYTPTHTRYAVWLVGFTLGYIMHINKNNNIRLHKALRLVGWIVCFTIIFSVIFGPHHKVSEQIKAGVLEAAAYESLKRFSWGIALGWIVFACHFKFGGLVNSFLSHPFWQPLGRLTYCLYLVHIAVQSINFGIIRTDVFFSDYTQIIFFWGNFGISILAAIVLSLTFEAPILVIEKRIFGNNKKETHAKSAISEPVHPSVEVLPPGINYKE